MKSLGSRGVRDSSDDTYFTEDFPLGSHLRGEESDSEDSTEGRRFFLKLEKEFEEALRMEIPSKPGV